MNIMDKKAGIAVLSALLYGISIPVSKMILSAGVSPDMLAAFTYLGAGLGLGFYNFFKVYALKKPMTEPLTKKELPYTIAMVILDIAAIILLMNGIAKTNGASASLLSNCEIAATSLIALIFFKEYISKNLWIAIALIITSGAVLTYEGAASLEFSAGSLLVTASYICWGAENNCTKMISSKDTLEITAVKGFFSGAGSLAIAFFKGAVMPDLKWLLIILLTGFLSYGLSVSLYIKSQKYSGAAKTAAYFASAPFFGVFFSIIILGETPDLKFYAALVLMAAAALFVLKDFKTPENKQ